MPRHHHLHPVRSGGTNTPHARLKWATHRVTVNHGATATRIRVRGTIPPPAARSRRRPRLLLLDSCLQRRFEQCRGHRRVRRHR
jgi:hypothetical protein